MHSFRSFNFVFGITFVRSQSVMSDTVSLNLSYHPNL